MGYEVPVTRPGRPTVVTAAVACLFVLAVVQITSGIIALVSYGPMIDAARDYAGGTDEGDTIIAAQQIGRYVGFAISALFAIGYAVLGIFTSRGKNPARIVSWVVLGIGLCCNAGGLVTTAVGGAFPGGGGNSGSDVDVEELQRRMSDALPGWANAASYVLLTISILAALAAIILLALPVANEFFRKVEPVWEPPVPGSLYPVSDQPPQAAAAAPDPAPAAPAQAAAPDPAPAAAAPAPAEPAEPADSAEHAEPVQHAKADESTDSDQPGGGSRPPVP